MQYIANIQLNKKKIMENLSSADHSDYMII